MKWIARILVFVGALAVGTFATTLFLYSSLSMAPLAWVKAPVNAGVLLGTWKGPFGRDQSDCTIEIHRVEGDKFFGTLRKEGAVVRFEGTFDAKTRRVRFDETRVLRLGANMAEWSLGTNSGILSKDGRILVGEGVDKWGDYSWAVSNY